VALYLLFCRTTEQSITVNLKLFGTGNGCKQISTRSILPDSFFRTYGLDRWISSTLARIAINPAPSPSPTPLIFRDILASAKLQLLLLLTDCTYRNLGNSLIRFMAHRHMSEFEFSTMAPRQEFSNSPYKPRIWASDTSPLKCDTTDHHFIHIFDNIPTPKVFGRHSFQWLRLGQYWASEDANWLAEHMYETTHFKFVKIMFRCWSSNRISSSLQPTQTHTQRKHHKSEAHLPWNVTLQHHFIHIFDNIPTPKAFFPVVEAGPILGFRGCKSTSWAHVWDDPFQIRCWSSNRISSSLPPTQTHTLRKHDKSEVKSFWSWAHIFKLPNAYVGSTCQKPYIRTSFM